MSNRLMQPHKYTLFELHTNWLRNLNSFIFHSMWNSQRYVFFFVSRTFYQADKVYMNYRMQYSLAANPRSHSIQIDFGKNRKKIVCIWYAFCKDERSNSNINFRNVFFQVCYWIELFILVENVVKKIEIYPIWNNYCLKMRKIHFFCHINFPKNAKTVINSMMAFCRCLWAFIHSSNNNRWKNKQSK